jgi:hypothetical protein
MSGSWGSSFDLVSNSIVTITLRYKLTQSTPYELDEYSEVLVSIDGVLIGDGGNDYVARTVGDGEGGPDNTTGWQQFSTNTGTISAGTHTLRIGCYNNKKSYTDEETEILIDDVVISRPVEMVMTRAIESDPNRLPVNEQPSQEISIPPEHNSVVRGQARPKKTDKSDSKLQGRRKKSKAKGHKAGNKRQR